MPTKGGSRRAARRAFTTAQQEQQNKPAATVLAPTPIEDWMLDPHRFWLVQRLERNTQPGRGWFNDKFKLDYMGSAEFEFGASHDSLKRMREAGNLEIREMNITVKGVEKTAYFVASCNGEYRDSFDFKLPDFQSWLDRGLPAKEYTNFDMLVTEDFRLYNRKYIRTVAWWSFDADIMWTLERSVAEELLYGLEHLARN